MALAVPKCCLPRPEREGATRTERRAKSRLAPRCPISPSPCQPLSSGGNPSLTKLSIARHFVEVATEGLKDGNVLNCWATRCGRPLLISQGQDAHADNVLAAAHAASALILPLMAGNQPAGTMQLFSSQPAHFSKA